MENRQIKLFNLAFDSIYNLKYNGRCSALLKAKMELIMDDLTQEVLKYKYDFRLNDKTQKFRLLKIK